jgi:hypothetical protein
VVVHLTIVLSSLKIQITAQAAGRPRSSSYPDPGAWLSSPPLPTAHADSSISISLRSYVSIVDVHLVAAHLVCGYTKCKACWSYEQRVVHPNCCCLCVISHVHQRTCRYCSRPLLEISPVLTRSSRMPALPSILHPRTRAPTTPAPARPVHPVTHGPVRPTARYTESRPHCTHGASNSRLRPLPLLHVAISLAWISREHHQADKSGWPVRAGCNE